MNNASDLNTNNKAVRDISESNSKNSKEEINQAKQELLILEAIENSEVYKRLKQTLSKTTNNRIQVSPEEILEIYTSMVSPSANTVGNKGVFFVDEGLVAMAVGGICYDLSIEENGLVLNVDGSLNVEGTKRQVAMLSGGRSPEELAEHKAQLMEEKRAYFDEKNISNDIKKAMELDAETEKFSRQFYGKHGADLAKALRSKETIAEMDKANNSVEMKKSMSDNRAKANLETAEHVEMMEYARRIYEYDKKIKETSDPKEKQSYELKKLGLLKTIKERADSGNEVAKKFVIDGKISLTALINSFKDYRDSYSSKEGVKFLMQFHPKKLAKYADTPIERLTLQQNQERQKIIKTAIAIYYSDSKEVDKAARMTAYRYLSASGLTDSSGVMEEAVVKILNELLENEHSKQFGVQKFSSFGDVRRVAMEDFETEAVQNIANLNEEIKNETFVNRTEEEARQTKKSVKKQTNENKAKISLRSRINVKLREIYAEARDDKISEGLEALFDKVQVEEDVYKTAIIGKAYLYNLQKALSETDPEETRKYKANVRAIISHVRNNQGRYRDITDKSGNINHQEVEKLVDDLDGFEINEWLKEQGVSEADVSEVFEESWRDKKNPKYIARAMVKTAQKFVRTEIRYLKSTKVGNVLFGNFKNLLPNARGKEKDTFDAGESLTQEQIDLLIADMKGKGVSEDLEENMSKEKSFDEQLREGVKVDEREAIQKTQEKSSQAVLKVDEKTLRKMAFELCQKNDIDPMQVNVMSITELQNFVDHYSDELQNPVQLQDDVRKEQPVNEGMEI